jgi:SnoaL-like domain
MRRREHETALKIGCGPLCEPADAADRLAIINLFGAYAYTSDENELDEFRALFTDSPELVLRHEDRMLSQDIDTVMNFLAARKAAFKAENTNAATG